MRGRSLGQQGRGIMGKEQELLQAVKTGDLQATMKLLTRMKSSRNSE